MKKKILFVNHKSEKCGMYEFGFAIGKALSNSLEYDFKYFECASWEEYKIIYAKEKPDAVIYNYSFATMPWISKSFLGFPNTYRISIPQIGIIHEVYQELADKESDMLFNYHIAADPTLLLKNPTALLGSFIKQKPILDVSGTITVGKLFWKKTLPIQMKLPVEIPFK